MRKTTAEPPQMQDRSSQPSESPGRRTHADEELIVPVLQEVLNVGTRRIETDSGVRIHKKVLQQTQLIDEPLVKDALSVERVAIDRYIDAPMDVRYEGETMVVPILEEVLVVEKRLLLKEEVRITRQRTEHRAPQRVTLRREQVEVEEFGTRPDRDAAADASPPAAADESENRSLFAKARAWMKNGR